MQDPEVTIGMTAYNDEKYIAEAIESWLNQTYRNFILLISDDCSTDKTPSICKRYAAQDPRIRYVRHEKNGGSLFNFNYVVQNTRTPFFISCAGHDRYDPRFIKTLLPLAQREGIAIAYPKSQEIEMDGTLGTIYEDNYTNAGMSAAERYRFVLANLRTCNVFQGVWKTAAVRDIYLRPVIANDSLMLLHAALRGAFVQYQEVLYFRRKTREEKKDGRRWKRQASMITGRPTNYTPGVAVLKIQFILENVWMLWSAHPPLHFWEKVSLSVYTVGAWANRMFR